MLKYPMDEIDPAGMNDELEAIERVLVSFYASVPCSNVLEDEHCVDRTGTYCPACLVYKNLDEAYDNLLKIIEAYDAYLEKPASHLKLV